MEDTSIQGQLAELKLMTEENNRILKAMRRDAIIGAVVKFAVWIILIGASFYFSAKLLEPYLGMLQGTQAGGQEQDFSKILEQYRELMGQ